MTKLRALALVLVSLLGAGSAAAQPRAGDCVIGPGVGATLLIPYFELDLAHPFNVTTLISVNNAYSFPKLCRVVLWTDWGVPTLAFDIYLTGFDVQTMNIRDLFNGVIPSTGEGADLSEFQFCDGLPPYHGNPVLSANERAQLAADHTGQLGPIATDCAGSPHPDHIARGYMTIDVVDECSGVEGFAPTFTPANTTYPYFANGSGAGIAIDEDGLWGDVIYVDVANAAAQGSEAVALWADPTLFSGTDIFTFYGRLSGWDGRDDRVPLPWLWDQRFVNGGPFAGGADLIVWRDTEALPQAVACGSAPSWYPLTTFLNQAFDEDGNSVLFGNGHFPAATQRVSVSSLSVPYNFGWLQVGGAFTQSWVQPTLGAGGLFSASWNGTPVEFTCGPRP